MDNSRALDIRSHVGNLHFQYGAIDTLGAAAALCAAELSQRPEAVVPILGLWFISVLQFAAAEELSDPNKSETDALLNSDPS
ncbi:hypothetical protein HY469_00895 [Candidatus Roizmanbacteria bacterium]|nr:hypothetical protein [Candidatus Roizmanbacteria bacterium]